MPRSLASIASSFGMVSVASATGVASIPSAPRPASADRHQRTPRHRAASFQSIRHAQRRSGIVGAGIDVDEINSALKAAERALGMEPGLPTDDSYHSIYHPTELS